MLRSIRPTRATTWLAASVDPTDARKDAGHARAGGGTELGCTSPDVRHEGKMRRGVER